MEKYLDHSAGYLEELLAACSDFKERQHIRGALRELKGLKLEGGTVITYSFGSDSIKHAKSLPHKREEKPGNSQHRKGDINIDPNDETNKDKSPWRKSKLRHGKNSPRSSDNTINEENSRDNKSTSNNNTQNYRSYLYAGKINSPGSEGTEGKLFVNQRNPGNESRDREQTKVRRPASASFTIGHQGESDQLSLHGESNRKFVQRPVSLRLSGGNDRINTDTSPRTHPPLPPRKPRRISYRTSPFSSTSTSPFSPQSQQSPRNTKISLTSPKLEGIRSKSAQGNISGTHSRNSPRKCNRFFADMKADNVRSNVSEISKDVEDDSVFDSISIVNESDKKVESVSGNKLINAMNSDIYASQMSPQNGNQNQEEVGKENIILSRKDRDDEDISEGKTTPRKKSSLSRKKRVNSDSYKELRLANQKVKEDGLISPKVSKSESAHSRIKNELTTKTYIDINRETSENVVHNTRNSARDSKVQTPRRKLPQLPAKNEEEDDETIHARTIRLLQERKKDRIKKQQPVPETPEKSKMTQEEVKKKLEQKLERSDSKRKAARVRRELQLLNREKEAKSPRPNGVELSVINIDSVREREPRRKLVQRSKSDIVKSKPFSVEVKEVTQDVTDEIEEFKSDLMDQIEATCAKGPLSPVSKIEIIGSLMQEEARLQEMLRKSSNFSEKRKMRAEIRRLREKRVELENFTNKSPAVTVKRCASVTAGLITPASIPDKSHVDMPARPSINDLRRQLSETTDYDEKKKIRLALRHLRQQTRDGTVNQTGVQRSQSFAHATSSQPVCNGDVPLNRPPVARSHSVTEIITNSLDTKEPFTTVKHDAGQLSCDVTEAAREVGKPEPVIHIERKAQFRKPTQYKTATENRQSLKERENLQLGRVSAPILSQEFRSSNAGTKTLKETHSSSVEKKPPIPESIRQSKSSSYVPVSLSRKHSLDSINNKQNSEQDGKNKLFERRKLFENGVNNAENKSEPKSKSRTSNILISRGNLSNTRNTNENTSSKSVEPNNLKTELLTASDRKTTELTNKRHFLDRDNVKDTERKLSPSLLWLEDKRKSLPTLKDLDKLMSTMDIEAAFTQILDDVDTEPVNSDAVDVPVIGIKTTADIPIVEEELSESSVNEELEALENSRNAEKNKSTVTDSVQDKIEISEDIMTEMNGEKEEDTDNNSETKVEECNNNDKSAIPNPGIKKSEATIQLQSNLSLELPTPPEPNSAISVIHGEYGTVTVQEVTKAQEGDTTITEWKKIRRTQSRTETRETDTVREKKSMSPGGGSTVYEKDVSKTKKKLTSRGSEYFSRNNYNIKRVKDPEGSETVLHELSSENKNLSVTKNESWGDKSEAQIVLTKDEGAMNGVEAKQTPMIQEDEIKPRKSVVRTTSMCQIRLSNNTAVVDKDSKLEAQLGRPSGCPHITSMLTEVSAIEGSTARLECVIKATPPATMTWFRGDIQLLEREDTKFGLDRTTGTAWLQIDPVRMGHVGDYKCVFENEKGSAASTGKLLVTAKPGNPPSFLTSLEDICVRESQPVTLQCSVMDTDSVAWYKDGVIQPNNPDFKQTFDGQTATMEISELFLDDSGTYTCVLRSTQGQKKTSCNIEVTESESSHEVFPAFLKKPETQIADELDTVIIECDIIGSPEPDISWLQEGSAIIQNEQNSFSYDGRVARLIMKRVTLGDNGKIECIAANTCGKVSADCMLVVKAVKKEPKITTPLEDITVEFGKVAILECGIVGATAENICWRKNDCIIGQTFDFKQIYKDNKARLEIQNVCKADSGFYECTVTTDEGSISAGCELTIKDKAESQPSEPQSNQPSEPQLSVQEEKAQTAKVQKFPTRFVPKVDKDQIKTSKSQASKVMLVRQGSWRIPGSEKTETPLKRTGSWQSLSTKAEKSETVEKSEIDIEPVITIPAKSGIEPVGTIPATEVVTKSGNDSVTVGNVADDSKQAVSVDNSKPEQKNEVDYNKNNIAGVSVDSKEAQSKFISSKQELFDNKAAVKVDTDRTPLCSKEDSDIKPKMKFKLGGEIRRTQSTRAPGNEKPEWLQVKLRSVGAKKSPLSTKEKEAIEKSYGQSDSQSQEKLEKPVVQESQVKLSRSQSARVVDRTNNPALRDSTNSPSNDPNKSAPKLTPVSERAKIFQMRDSNSGKSSPTEIISKALNLCRAESMRSPVGRSSVNVQRSHSFKTSAQTGPGGVTLDLSPQQSKGQEEKGDLGSSPKVIKYWDPTTPKTSTMADVSSITNEDQLHEMLSKTEDFDERKKIRNRMKELREIHAKEWNARTEARKALQEDEIKKKHREADLEKQRKLEAFKEQAKEKHEGKHLDMAEQHLRERMRSADEAKRRQLENFDKLARKEDVSQTSKTTTDVSKDGKTTTTTRRTETVTKVGGAKPAEELAPVMLQQIINATSPHVSGGSLKVKTESWSSKDGVTNTSEKTESWGGRGGARNMFKTMDAKTNPGGATGRQGGAIMRSPSAIKTMLLEWCKAMTREYVEKIEITNFSTSWNNGLAFCALIHHFYPDSFDFDSLDAKHRRKNFELAFDTAEKLADIAPLLDVEDMVRMQKPDWKCVFTYVQSFYRKLQNHERNKAMTSES